MKSIHCNTLVQQRESNEFEGIREGCCSSGWLDPTCLKLVRAIDADVRRQAPQTLKQKFNIVRRLFHDTEPWRVNPSMR